MARTNLEFEYNGKEYKLAYTIEIVKRLDRMGFIAHLEERPLTITEDLFIAAFEANHSETSNRIRGEIYKEFSETSDDGSLLEVLIEMIAEVQKSMAPKGNVQWRVNKG